MRVKRIELLNQLTKLEKIKTECHPESQYKCECSVCQDIRKIGNQLMVLVPPRRYIWAEYADEAIKTGYLTPQLFVKVLENEGSINELGEYLKINPLRISRWIKDEVGFTERLYEPYKRKYLEYIKTIKCEPLRIEGKVRRINGVHFDDDTVRKIRKAYENGVTVKELVELYGAARKTIYNIANRRTYKWVD